MAERLQPAFWGGLFIGVLSALPIVQVGNCCCCLWVVTGGVLAAYLRQQQSPYAIPASEGALVGLHGRDDRRRPDRHHLHPDARDHRADAAADARLGPLDQSRHAAESSATPSSAPPASPVSVPWRWRFELPLLHHRRTHLRDARRPAGRRHLQEERATAAAAASPGTVEVLPPCRQRPSRHDFQFPTPNCQFFPIRTLGVGGWKLAVEQALRFPVRPPENPAGKTVNC